MGTINPFAVLGSRASSFFAQVRAVTSPAVAPKQAQCSRQHRHQEEAGGRVISQVEERHLPQLFRGDALSICFSCSEPSAQRSSNFGLPTQRTTTSRPTAVDKPARGRQSKFPSPKRADRAVMALLSVTLRVITLRVTTTTTPYHHHLVPTTRANHVNNFPRAQRFLRASAAVQQGSQA